MTIDDPLPNEGAFARSGALCQRAGREERLIRCGQRWAESSSTAGRGAWRLCVPKAKACGRWWPPCTPGPITGIRQLPVSLLGDSLGGALSGVPFPTLPPPGCPRLPHRFPTQTPLGSGGDPHRTGHRHGAGPQPTAPLVRAGGDGSPLITTDRVNEPPPLPLITQHTDSSSGVSSFG